MSKPAPKNYSRRYFIKQTALTSVAFVALYNCTSKKKAEEQETNQKKLTLETDPKKYLDLPKGFTYKIISKSGDTMSDGFLVPGRPDGMGAFTDELGRTILVINHENGALPLRHGPFGEKNELLEKVVAKNVYDFGEGKRPGLGGTTTLIYDEDKGEVVEQFMSLSGTYRNCAGGVTPWGSWLTCEEDVTTKDEDNVEQDHGYVFEVPAKHKGLVEPVPIKEMGRFNHEAVAVDPKSGVVYLTEDRNDGLIYRFIPNEKENLLAGGKLQALMIKDQKGFDTRNWDETTIKLNEKLAVVWLDVEDVLAPKDDLRLRGFEAGAARFARGEGMWMGDDEVYFACTNGGKSRFGQVFKYKLSPNEGTAQETEQHATLELYAESEDKSVLHMCDNVTIAPWGDVFLCEDNGELNHIKGINKEGEIYTFACNRSSESELTGAVFSPSGKTLFVNVQENGDVVAITGPWNELV